MAAERVDAVVFGRIGIVPFALGDCAAEIFQVVAGLRAQIEPTQIEPPQIEPGKLDESTLPQIKKQAGLRPAWDVATKNCSRGDAGGYRHRPWGLTRHESRFHQRHLDRQGRDMEICPKATHG
jgi:hypothetical protein